MTQQSTNLSRWKLFHDLAGVLVKDVWRYAPALWDRSSDQRHDARWTNLRNRNEVLIANSDGRGVKCDWTWSSELHACKVVPAFGRRLLTLALTQWPIRFADSPLSSSGPRISFVFAHEGTERLPHLRQVICSIFAQQGVQVECVVVDLSPEPIHSHLPPDVVYRHVDSRGIPPGWRKAWAFNIAARQATGEFFVFHDGDICVPDQYASELIATFERGYDAVSLHRFLFYLDKPTTQQVFDSGSISFGSTPIRVLQNFKGGTIATTRSTYFEIGGFDEAFVGWGGEDDEFYNRCGARRHCRFGYLPFVHLWHPPQRDRIKPDNLNISQVLPRRLNIPAEQRMAELRRRDFGNVEGPDPVEGYKDQFAKMGTAAR